MKIELTITDDRQSVRFVSGCAGLWGLYEGDRVVANQWLGKGRTAMEDRYWDVVTGGAPRQSLDPEEFGYADHEQDLATFRWVMTECPLVALATMCAEWGAP